MLSTVGSFEETGQWLDAGISAFLTKPVRQIELYDALADALDMTRPMSCTLDELADAGLGDELPRFNGRVLVAEDNPVNQELARTLLENLGCRVEVVDNGQGAIDMIVDSPLDKINDPFDLILMDVQMPDVDGLEATATIRDLRTAAGRQAPPYHCADGQRTGGRPRTLPGRAHGRLSRQTVHAEAARAGPRALAAHLPARNRRTTALDKPVTPPGLSAGQRPCRCPRSVGDCPDQGACSATARHRCCCASSTSISMPHRS